MENPYMSYYVDQVGSGYAAYSGAVIKMGMVFWVKYSKNSNLL